MGDGSSAESIPPADIAAERAVAGALVLAPPEMSRPVLDRLRDSDFTDPRCRFVAATVRRMLADGVPPDLVTLPAFAERHALLEPGPARTELRTFVAEIASGAPVVASLGYYADIVIEVAARRRGYEAGRRLARLAVGADLDGYAAGLRAELLACLDALDRCGITAGRVNADV